MEPKTDVIADSFQARLLLEASLASSVFSPWQAPCLRDPQWDYLAHSHLCRLIFFLRSKERKTGPPHLKASSSQPGNHLQKCNSAHVKMSS